MSISPCLIITTYNYPAALALILDTIKIQTTMPREVIVADDGSGSETKELIARYIPGFPVPLKHVWHEDTGFRRSEILNKAIAGTTCNYIIQIDGDVILHKHFVHDHLHFAKQGYFLFGTRVHIKQSYVPTVLKNKKITFHFFSRGLKNRFRRVRKLSVAQKREDFTSISGKLRGCNLSYWREDFIKINGYNEDIFGWGREDSELAIRFHNAGLKAKRLVYCAICYHLDHPEKSRDRLNDNDKIEEETKREKYSRTANGIDKYL